MITIINTGPTIKARASRGTVLGAHDYELSIFNGRTTRVVATFTHTRSNGLAACLLNAHKAVKAVEAKAKKEMKAARKEIKR